MQLLPSFRSCYFCGTGNRSGLRIRYALERATQRVIGSVSPGAEMCGYPEILHGGIQAALLDDVMFWAVAHRHATSCATVELTCKYHAPANLGQKFRLEAAAEPAAGRKVGATACLLSASGEPLATADAVYVLHSTSRYRDEILPLLDFDGCEAPMVRHFRGPEEAPQVEHPGDTK